MGCNQLWLYKMPSKIPAFCHPRMGLQRQFMYARAGLIFVSRYDMILCNSYFSGKGLDQVVYLKRLEMLGFKSFASRTFLEFSPGITAVIGPNGSGKSNVADSMRWVLGEQNMRQLRGK